MFKNHEDSAMRDCVDRNPNTRGCYGSSAPNTGNDTDSRPMDLGACSDDESWQDGDESDELGQWQM